MKDSLLELIAPILSVLRAHPALRDLALVGAAYGVANRTLGAVSLLGPVRMDYEHAIRTVRAAASELSRFSEAIFGEN